MYVCTKKRPYQLSEFSERQTDRQRQRQKDRERFYRYIENNEQKTKKVIRRAKMQYLGKRFSPNLQALEAKEKASIANSTLNLLFSNKQ